MKITIAQLRKIIREAKKGQYSIKDIIRDHGPQRTFVDEDGAEYLKREARHTIEFKFGGDYENDDAEDDFYEWGEATDYDLYDLRVAWEAVVEEFEAAEEAAKEKRVPEWETQEWYDETMEDYENDSLESLRHSESAFEDSVRRDEQRGGYANSAESRAILKIIRDLIEKKTGSKIDREDPTSKKAMRRATRLRSGEKTVY